MLYHPKQQIPFVGCTLHSLQHIPNRCQASPLVQADSSCKLRTLHTSNAEARLLGIILHTTVERILPPSTEARDAFAGCGKGVLTAHRYLLVIRKPSFALCGDTHWSVP